LCWDSYPAALERNREAGVAWMFIPAAEAAAEMPTGYRNRLTDGLCDRFAIRQDQIVTATPDYLLFLELLDVLDCTAELGRLLRRRVDRTLRQGSLPRCPDLYDATHAIFYLTRFGRLPRRHRALPVAFCDKFCAAAIRQADEVTSIWRPRSPPDCSMRESRSIAERARSPGGSLPAPGPMAAWSAREGETPPLPGASGTAAIRRSCP
jgi:hypothetical protein